MSLSCLVKSAQQKKNGEGRIRHFKAVSIHWAQAEERGMYHQHCNCLVEVFSDVLLENRIVYHALRN